MLTSRQTHCQSCGISRWQGRPLALELRHLNGDGNDNRVANLQLLCPNCHSQVGGREQACPPTLRLIENPDPLAPSSATRAALRVLPPPSGGDAA